MTGLRSLDLLVERLHWPVPRVRWEAARQLAKLVRGGDDEAGVALLSWSAAQRLESDAVVLPSLLHAYSLERHFSFDEVNKAVAAPSILSDALLRNLYPDSAAKLFSFRLGYTKHGWRADHDPLFEGGLGTLVPNIFRSVLAAEEKKTSIPFLSQWRGEWVALQNNRREVYTRYPSYFSAGDRSKSGPIDVRQRAVFVSAFLRTFSWAHLECRMPQSYAVGLTDFALPFNRGLADFECSQRPAWSGDFLERFNSMAKSVFAKEAWRQAAATVPAGFEPIALGMIDQSELLAVRLQIFRVMEGRDTDGLAKDIEFPEWISTLSDSWTLPGPLPSSQPRPDATGLLPLCVAANSGTFARAHVDLMPDKLLVADPLLGEGEAELACEPDRLTLCDSGGLLSELQLWYANWAPTHPGYLPQTGWLTTLRSSALRAFRKRCDVKTPRIARLEVARREHSYEPFETTKEVFRLP